MADERAYEFLEHTADAYIAAYGRDLGEAFANAARALFDVMTQVEKVRPKTLDVVEVEGEDEYSLLYRWLEALLIKSETKGMLYSKFQVSITEKTPVFRLKARVWGEKFDAQRHLQKVGVKAVTYHRMEIIKSPEKITLRFILDI
jgi:SHS2 domain-containing protein